MILGIGTDIIELSRVGKAIGSERFVERVYTEREQAYCDSRGAQRVASYAARWAGKEAVVKAFGTGLREGSFTEIEILPDDLGCPRVTLTGFWAKLARSRGAGNVWLSLSHAQAYAAAQCVLEGTEGEGRK